LSDEIINGGRNALHGVLNHREAAKAMPPSAAARDLRRVCLKLEGGD
jgi:hypothetical protein